jgi:hypothetical protein
LYAERVMANSDEKIPTNRLARRTSCQTEMDLLNGCSVCITADILAAVPFPQNSSYLPTLIKKVFLLHLHVSEHLVTFPNLSSVFT